MVFVRPRKWAPRARVRWNDRRILPFVLYGFLLASAQAVNQQTLGFMVIDKLAISPAKAAAFAGVAMMAGAVASLLAQWGLIRMLSLKPRQLLWLGAGCAVLGNLIVAFSPDYHTLVVGFALCSLGYGFARPGFTAGALQRCIRSRTRLRCTDRNRSNGPGRYIDGTDRMVYSGPEHRRCNRATEKHKRRRVSRQW